MKADKQTKSRLEYLRGEIKAERISYNDIAELQSLVDYIDKDDVLLLEWAGKEETRTIEYYRLWGGDHGTWDTDFVEIPADTPEEHIEEAVQSAVSEIDWKDEVPVITGIYNIPEADDS
jgi:hypothetical protein